MTRVRIAVITVAAAAAMTVFPVTSHGLVTIGSNLQSGPSNVGPLCIGGTCTRAQISLPADRRAVGGVTSPVNGTVTGWRVRSDASDTPQPIAFRVISPAPGGLFTGGGTSGTLTPADVTGTQLFPTSIPIKIGDHIGLDYGSAATFYFRIGGGLGAERLFDPALAPGQTRPATAESGNEALINADIEPTSTFQVLSRKKRNGGKLKVRVSLPNAGELVADGRRFKETARTVSAPGELTFKLRPTKRTRNLLDDRNKVKAKALIEFTPTFGTTPGEQRVRAKIQR